MDRLSPSPKGIKGAVVGASPVGGHHRREVKKHQGANENNVRRRKEKRFSFFDLFMISSIIATSVFIIMSIFFANFTWITVHGSSMDPTLHDGESLLFLRDDTLTKGDFVVFTSPEKWFKEEKPTPSEVVIKRVVGTPGDTVSMSKGVISINGEQVFNYLDWNNYRCVENDEEVVIPRGSFMAAGDNTQVSIDSFRVACYTGSLERSFAEKDAIITSGDKVWEIPSKPFSLS